MKQGKDEQKVDQGIAKMGPEGMGMTTNGSDHGAQQRPTLLERLAEKVGVSADSRKVYGEPVEHDGVTVIPVAKVAYGFGGGSGGNNEGKGEGGGGGVNATPIGYIEIRDGESAFRRIVDPMSLVPVIVAGGAAAAMILRAVYKIMNRNDSKAE